MAVVASGDCQDPDLIADLRLLTQSLQARLPGGVLDETALRRRLDPAPTSGLKDLELQLQAAQNLFYNGSYARAERQLEGALEEVQKLPPGTERWNLYAMLQVFRGLTLKHENRPREAREATREVLRVAPGFQLDRDQFAPQTHRQFEEVRREVTHAPHLRLEVTSEPTGANVFLNGFPVGKTPYVGERVAGTYQVMVAKDSHTSLRHSVDLTKPARVAVDLDFEGALSPQRLACVREEPGRPTLGRVLKWGALINTEDLILLRLDRSGGAGPGWLKASVLHVATAQMAREGGIRVLPGVSPPEGLDDLVTFLLTGQSSRAVVPAAQMPLPWVLEAPPGAPPSAALGPTGAAPALGVSSRLHVNWPRPAWGLVGAGVVGLGVGAFLELQAANHWSSFNGYYSGANTGPGPGDLAMVESLRSQARTEQTLGWVGIAVGAASLGAGSYLLHQRSTPHVTLTGVGMVPTEHGASAALMGQWP